MLEGKLGIGLEQKEQFWNVCEFGFGMIAQDFFGYTSHIGERGERISAQY